MLSEGFESKVEIVRGLGRDWDDRGSHVGANMLGLRVARRRHWARLRLGWPWLPSLMVKMTGVCHSIAVGLFWRQRNKRYKIRRT